MFEPALQFKPDEGAEAKVLGGRAGRRTTGEYGVHGVGDLCWWKVLGHAQKLLQCHGERTPRSPWASWLSGLSLVKARPAPIVLRQIC